jgi:hypothetical protein
MAEMTRQDLESKNELYQKNITAWNKYELVWRSGKDLLEHAIYRHERESSKNFNSRKKDAYVFNFAKSIIDIYNFYLNEKKVTRELPQIDDDEQWKMFVKDADLNGTNYNVLIDEIQKFASVYGSFGILVNKAGDETATVAAEIEKGIYPYYALFSLPNIYDWKFEKNPATHRRELVYLKLKEAGDNYLIWTREDWQQWTMENTTKKPELAGYGKNPLGEVPFVWMLNIKDLAYPEIGSSDLVDIADIVISIIQNLSCGEEMIKLAGFPIMREPMETDIFGDDDDESDTGPRAVKPFNPEMGAHGKADWMPTEILEPVTANLQWIDRKADEIYRVAHLSGVHGQRKSNNEVSSGMALRYELSQLNQVLNAKGINQTEAELSALRYWLMWQDKEALLKEIDIRRSSEFSIDELSIALENAIRSYQNVVSRTFRKRVMKKMAEHTLPDLSQKDKDQIEKELEANLPEKTEILDGKSIDSVRDAYQSRADHSKDGD